MLIGMCALCINAICPTPLKIVLTQSEENDPFEKN